MQVKNQFDKSSLTKIGKGALIAGGAAIAIYLLTWVTSLDFGQFTPMVVGVAAILINSIKEYRKGE